MSDYSCYHCGKEGYKSGNYDPTPKGWVYNKSFGFGAKLFCSNKCLSEFNSPNSEKSNNSTSNENNEDAKEQAAEAKAQAAEAKSKENTAKWNTYATLGTAAFTAASSTGKEVKETTDYLAKITFSNDAEELGNQLSEICSLWGGSEKYFLSDNKEAVKKAAFEKFEFGFMKLKQIGMPHQVDFFTKKQKEMKPKRFGFF